LNSFINVAYNAFIVFLEKKDDTIAVMCKFKQITIEIEKDDFLSHADCAAEKKKRGSGWRERS
jgi:hypothetical protein